jgi:hypothetical protein
MSNQDYEPQIKKNRPNLAHSSIRTYCSILANLSKQLGRKFLSPEDCVKDHKMIIEHLKDLEPKIRKTRLSALVVYCDGDTKNDSAIEAFRTKMMDDGKKSEEEKDDQKMNEKQKEAMIPLADVMKMYADLEKEVTPLFKRESLDKRQFGKVQMYVLLSCLLLIPPRRSLDYTEFKLRDIDKEANNYLIVEKRKPYFVFNVYKTAKKYKTQKEEIPAKLQKIINSWAKLNPHEWLLMNSNQSNKITPTQLTSMLYSFFGKPISTSMLRHIYLTDKYGNMPSIKDMQQTASEMGHSMHEMLTYIKK